MAQEKGGGRSGSFSSVLSTLLLLLPFGMNPASCCSDIQMLAFPPSLQRLFSYVYQAGGLVSFPGEAALPGKGQPAARPVLLCGRAAGSHGRRDHCFLPPFVLTLSQAASLPNNGKGQRQPRAPYLGLCAWTWASLRPELAAKGLLGPGAGHKRGVATSAWQQREGGSG